MFGARIVRIRLEGKMLMKDPITKAVTVDRSLELVNHRDKPTVTESCNSEIHVMLSIRALSALPEDSSFQGSILRA